MTQNDDHCNLFSSCSVTRPYTSYIKNECKTVQGGGIAKREGESIETHAQYHGHCIGYRIYTECMLKVKSVCDQ